ncbi:acyl carrier protein [Neolewinella lacunae]|uniref:Acyl carrier protein n=1 Tax=Neolewinella lacunae TaxID=1517758 RepID=A0A923PP65_9BACT|nr:acyl carrier protein [Neolewinella lacunae]MBC6994132.1 acyl carrier protein [Neolewinella lacunae]MDN3636719.1 acyl carrier protein [Neolewinella lacunae]
MEQTIIDYIKNEIHAGDQSLDIDPEDDLLGSGLLGSMEMMRLVEHLENTFHFRVQPQDMAIENFLTVAAMARYVSAARRA